MDDTRIPISKRLDEYLNAAFKRARRARYEFIELELLLLTLLDAREVAEILHACRADLVQLKRDLKKHISALKRVPAGKKYEAQPTLAFQRVIQRAQFHVKSALRSADLRKMLDFDDKATGIHRKTLPKESKADVEVRVEDVFKSIFSERQSFAVYSLNRQGVTRLGVVNCLYLGISEFIELRREMEEPAEDVEEHELVMAAARDGKSAISLPKVFISYSHADKHCLDRLLVHLKPLHRSGAIVCWSDKDIKPGEKWRVEIDKQIEQAAMAILLVTADFLASEFIVNNELPPLLIAAEARGLRVLPVILKPCGFHRDAVLSSFQCVNDPRVPLLGLTYIEQEGVYDQVANEVAGEMRSRNAVNTAN